MQRDNRFGRYVYTYVRMADRICALVCLFACAGSDKKGNRSEKVPSSVDGSELLRFPYPVLLYYFPFFLAFGFCIWELYREKKWMFCIQYGIACGFSLLLAVVSYPASLSHIFRGYRGTGAVGEFLDAANTGDRLSFFAGLVNEYLFDGYLWLWLLAIAVMTGIIMINGGKIKGRADGLERHVEIAPYFLLLFASLGYFFTVSKTALLLYETSNRYQLPIYGILV